MSTVLALLLANAVLGAIDTLWHHEYRARLAGRLATTRPELQFHVARDAIYVGLYGTLAWWRPSGWLAAALAVGLAAEIVVTMTDFIVEDRDRPAIGGRAPGECVLHSCMAIVYGAMLAYLVPEIVAGFGEADSPTRHGAPALLSVSAFTAALGIATSGLRDGLALVGIDPLARFLPAYDEDSAMISRV